MGGEPGIGKSTLTLQTLLRLPQHVLYVSGEESPHQIKMRADRIAGQNPVNDRMVILSETSLEAIFDHIKEEKPEIVVIDSIQTIATEQAESSPGSVSQVRECASALLRFAKSSGVPVILIGHINKEGTSPDRRSWSTSSIRCSSLRATSTTSTVSCAASKTASDPPRRSASTRCGSRGFVRWKIPRNCSSPTTTTASREWPSPAP